MPSDDAAQSAGPANPPAVRGRAIDPIMALPRVDTFTLSLAEEGEPLDAEHGVSSPTRPHAVNFAAGTAALHGGGLATRPGSIAAAPRPRLSACIAPSAEPPSSRRSRHHIDASAAYASALFKPDQNAALAAV